VIRNERFEVMAAGEAEAEAAAEEAVP
jgi:hypothetical protein